MDLLNREQLKDLAQVQNDLCISLYMPTVRVESDVSQNPIRLKNLLKEVRGKLKESGHREEQIDEVLKPAQSRLEDSNFWMYQSDGLAIFITPEDTKYFRLPLDFKELCFVGRRFLLKPLFPLIATNNRFYMLALNQKHVQLYLGTRYSMNEIEASEIPRSITDALFYDDPERQLQFRTANRAGERQDAMFHGQGRQNDDVRSRPQDTLRRFFREIDHGLMEHLRDETAPLLLAGVESHLPIYRESNSYEHLISDEIVGGNTEHLNLKDLHAKAWPVMERHFLHERQEAIEKFQELTGKDGELSSTEMDDIIASAAYSRVDTLFARVGEHRWGTFDPESGRVTVHDEYQPGDEDLLDLAAVNTYLNGGVVHALKEEDMPADAVLAATYRFPMQETAN